MAFIAEELPFSEGEDLMHQLLHVPHRDNPTSTFFSPHAAAMTTQSPLVAVGAIDAQGRPWTTIWGGAPGFAGPMGQLGTAKGNVLVIKAPRVDRKYDPVAEIVGTGPFQKSTEDGGVMVAALPIDLEARRRVKIFGRELAGHLVDGEGEMASNEDLGEIQMLVNVEQSIGNCPKYLNKKRITPATPNPKLFSVSSHLPEEAIELINHADLFFMSSANGHTDMDTNHRGGPAGFVRILSNSPTEGAVIVYPEYSGNRLYQSLGNLIQNPKVGVVFPDFDTGDVLYATGTADILTGQDAATVIPRTNLAVRIHFTEARFVLNGLPFRGIPGDPSPYNPPVRKLVSEGALDLGMNSTTSSTLSSTTLDTITATITKKLDLSPTITRYTLKASQALSHKPGQWVALDLSRELDLGYSHMRDEDPESLNDDYIRTFTISSAPESLPGDEFEITARTNGPTTTYLKKLRAGADGSLKEHVEVEVKGIGGDFDAVTSTSDRTQSLEEHGVTVFIAGGVGITPLLSHLPLSHPQSLRLMWTTPAADAPFALSLLSRYPDLARNTAVYFTSGTLTQSNLTHLENLGTEVHTRRLEQSDLLALESQLSSSNRAVSRWTVCAATGLNKAIAEWLRPRNIAFEEFNY